MKMELMFPSKYLRAVDLDGERLVTIADVVMDELVMRGGRREEKPVIHLKGDDKMLVLNKTNAETIAGLYGGESDEWRGKELVLFPTDVTFGRERVLAIRVRAPGGAKQAESGAPFGADEDDWAAADAEGAPDWFGEVAASLWLPLAAAFDADELARTGSAVKEAWGRKRINQNERDALKKKFVEVRRALHNERNSA